MIHFSQQDGYIALISVIVLTFVLGVLTVGSGWAVWGAQQNALLTESRAQSKELAKSCARFAALRLVNDNAFRGPETVVVSNLDSCAIVSIELVGGGVYAVETEATVNKTVAHMHTKLDSVSLQVLAQSQSP